MATTTLDPATRQTLLDQYTKLLVPCPDGFQDHVYKVVAGVEVNLRIWATNEERHHSPVLYWYHGGGFTGGTPWRPSSWAIKAFRSRGFHVVSVGYRMLPHVGISEMIADLRDAQQWCITHLPRLLGDARVDVGRFVVGGESAGGTLATLAGCMLQPRPLAVVDSAGIVDFEHLMQNAGGTWTGEGAVMRTGRYTDGDLERAESDREASGAIVNAFTPLEAYGVPLAVVRAFLGNVTYEATEAEYLRHDIAHHLITSRRLIPELCRSEDHAVWREWSAYHIVDTEKGYPPTCFVHGLADQLVAAEQSKRFASKLRSMSVDTFETYEEGAGHCFESACNDADDPLWQKHLIPCVEFAAKYAGI